MPTRTLAFALLLAAAACGGGGSSTSQPPPPPPTPAKLGFSVQPTSAISTTPIAPAVKVEIRDASGARVAGSTAAVTLAIAAGPPGAALAGTTTVAAVDGVATFGDLSIARAGAGYALAATSGTLTAATSAAFDVAVGPPAGLAFSAQPSSTTGGTPFSSAVAVEVRDAAGNAVTTSAATVSLSLAGGAAGATLAGTLAATAAAGIATFPGLSVDRAGTGYRLHATATGLAAADSAPFDVAVGPPAGLAFAVQPSDTRSTVPSSPAVAVDVVDAGGNAVAAATSAVSLAIASGPAVARLGGTVSVAAVAGRATFDTAAVDAAGRFTLRARSAGLPDAVSTSFAATDAWTPMGPDGGYVQRIAVHPTTPATLLAAAGAAGLWIYTDAAATWAQVPLPGKAGVDGVRFVPGAAGQAWAWGSAGTWFSADDGASWSAASPPQLTSYGPVVAEPGTGVAFTSGWDGAGYALLRSADHGATWAPISPALPAGASPWTLGVSSDGTLWVDTAGGVYRLASGVGATWTAAGTGPGGVAPGPFYAFAFHPTDPLKAWAGTYSKVYATADGGATWTAQVLNGSTVYDLAVDGTSATPALYAATYGSGVWRSPDGGATWAATGPMAIWSAHALAGSGAAVYAGTESGVWKTIDAGANWTRSSAGLRAATPSSLAFQPGATGVILAGGFGEVFRSTDGGGSWTRQQQGPGSYVRRIAFDPATPANAFATDDYHGLLRSTDAGVSWTAATGTSGQVMDLAVGGATPSVVWALTSAGVYRSVDGGATFAKAWNLAATASANALAADPSSGLVAWAGVQDSTPAASGVYQTIDGGTTWTLIAGSPAVSANSRLELVASAPAVFWLENGGSPYRSVDGAATWTNVYPANAGSQLWGMGSDPSDPLRCFIGSVRSGAYLTTDGGTSWMQLLRGLPPEVDRLVVDPAAPLTVYSLGGGLYRSTTGGL